MNTIPLQNTFCTPDLRVLRLTLHRKAFEVMVTGEKPDEYRDESQWITSRLFMRGHLPGLYIERPYDVAEFTNGYGADKPRFTAEYLGFERQTHIYKEYSNGLKVNVKSAYVIKLGKVLSIENYSIPVAP